MTITRINASSLCLMFAVMISSAAAAQTPPPQTLDACYMNVAMEKSTADMIYLAKEICDSIFKPKPRSIILLDLTKGRCQERWFDANGRYESADLYCAFEPRGISTWTYSCQGKGARSSRYTVIDVQEQGDRFVRVGATIGSDPGPLFKTLGACLRHKAGK